MIIIKEPITYEEQADLLEKRGCRISNKNDCIKKLSCINYYRFSAYLLPFRLDTNKYKEGTTFDQIYSTYEFDRKLRNLIYRAIEVVEISFRTRLAYVHSHQYGALGYQNNINFNDRHKHDKFLDKINNAIKINSKVPFVEHHLKNYNGKFPIWVAVELFTFGMLSRFYSDLKTSDKKEIAKSYNLNYKDLNSWLRCLTDLRNTCAHYGRLHYAIFSAAPANSNLQGEEKRKLWAVLIVLKEVYPFNEQWNSEFLESLRKLFEEHTDINPQNLGFPPDWPNRLIKY